MQGNSHCLLPHRAPQCISKAGVEERLRAVEGSGNVVSKQWQAEKNSTLFVVFFHLHCAHVAPCVPPSWFASFFYPIRPAESSGRSNQRNKMSQELQAFENTHDAFTQRPEHRHPGKMGCFDEFGWGLRAAVSCKRTDPNDFSRFQQKSAPRKLGFHQTPANSARDFDCNLRDCILGNICDRILARVGGSPPDDT